MSKNASPIYLDVAHRINPITGILMVLRSLFIVFWVPIPKIPNLTTFSITMYFITTHTTV